MKNNQSGFTLVEIAIVLVIIGLLLGGVLKGQELINSAKVKNFATDFRNIPLFIYGYQDKFKAIPGDDRAASTHVAGVPLRPMVTAMAESMAPGMLNRPAAFTLTRVMLSGSMFVSPILLPGQPITGNADYFPENCRGWNHRHHRGRQRRSPDWAR